MSSMLQGAVRRWYIVVAGVLLAVACAAAVWSAVPPVNQRSASLLLIPGDGNLPKGSSNPYLFLGGLSTATDVLARAAAQEDAISEIVREVPTTQITIVRDASTSAPVVAVTVLNETDQGAAKALDLVIKHVADTLESVQDEQKVVPAQRISLEPLNVDSQSTLQDKQRVTMAGGSAAGVAAFSVVLAGLVDTLIRRARPKQRGRRGSRRGGPPHGHAAGPDQPTSDPDVGLHEALTEPLGQAEATATRFDGTISRRRDPLGVGR